MFTRHIVLSFTLAATAFCSAAVHVTVPEEPQVPNKFQKAAILLTGIQQDEWTPAGAMKLWFPQAIALTAKKRLPLVKTCSPLADYSVMTFQRFLEEGDAKKAAQHALKDFALSQRISLPEDWSNHSPSINQVLCAARHLYTAYEANEVVKQVILECTRLEIESGIVQAVLPPDDSYVQINNPWNSAPRFLWAIKRFFPTINKIFGEKAGDGINWKEAKENWDLSAIALVVIGGYFYTKMYSNKTFIPKRTLEMLSFELQERCNDILWQQKNAIDPEYIYNIVTAIIGGDASKL